jgi:hypothetical protein
MSVLEKVRELLAPRVERSLAEAEQRRDRLAAEVAKLALPAALDEPGAKAALAKLDQQHRAAVDEVARLALAQVQARERDNAAAVEVEIGDLEAALAKYEGWAVARLDALRDMERATEAAREAARRFTAASSLLENATPPGCEAPRGFRLSATTMADVERENANLIGLIRKQVATVAAVRRGQEVA